jgi:hypothetical protein
VQSHLDTRAHGAHRLRLGEHLGIRADPHFQVLRPGTLCQQGLLELSRLFRAWLHGRQVVAHDGHDGSAHGCGLAGVAAGLLFDHAFEHAGHKGHAGRFQCLQIAGREEPGLAVLARVGRGVG